MNDKKTIWQLKRRITFLKNEVMARTLIMGILVKKTTTLYYGTCPECKEVRAADYADIFCCICNIKIPNPTEISIIF